MCRLEILPTAWKDLEQIEDWYTEQFGSQVAIRVSDNILNSICRYEDGLPKFVLTSRIMKS